MEFVLNDLQRTVQETARELAARVLAPRVEEIEREQKVPGDIVEAVAQAGLLGIPFPEAWGGLDGDYISLAIAFEELAKVSASASVSMLVSVSFLEGIRHYGSEEQKQRYLPEGIQGKIRGSLAFTEPGTGSDPKQILTSFRRDGDGYVLNGVKRFITNAGYEGPILLFAKDPENGAISAFVFDKFLPGYTLSTPWDKIGLRGSSIYDVFLDDVRIPASALVGEEGQGFSILLGTVAHSKVALCAAFVGTMAAGYEAAVRYAREKTHRDQPIAKFQAIQLKIARIAAMVESARLMTYRLAEQAGDRTNLDRLKAWVGLVKAYVSDLAVECGAMVMNVLGPYGVTGEYQVERFMRDALIAPNIEGVSDIQRIICAGYILKTGDLLL